jgi:putative hydrolase of HD superfamily
MVKNLLQFYIEAEKLKTTIRHSSTSDHTRMESSAEHSWMMCLIAMTLAEHIQRPVDWLRVLKMTILHDLAEAITGDIPAFEVSSRQDAKKQTEQQAMQHILRNLSKKTREEFLSLFNEFEDRQTIEAQIAQALDKIEAPLQHNIAGVATWDQNDFDIHPFYKYEFSQFDSFLSALREEVEHMSRKKITEAGQLSRIKPEHRKRYEQLNQREKK